MSFKVAKLLDRRGNFFKKLSKDLLKNKKTRTIKEFLSRKYDEGFLINYSKNEMLTLKNNMRKIFLKRNNKIVNIIKSLLLSKKNDDFKPIKNHEKSAICNWCPFWDECSAKSISNPHLKNLIKIHIPPKENV